MEFRFDIQRFWMCLLDITLVCMAVSGNAQTVVKGRKSLVLDGRAAQLIVDIGGGSIMDFHLKSQGLNPLNWAMTGDPHTARAMCHFLCLDRWGPASDAEQKQGMPFHGEAANVEWQVLKPPTGAEQKVKAEMGATLPLAGLKVKRTIDLSAGNALFVVREEVTNINKLGRIFNMVQHPTIGPPFLDENTLVDSNAAKGFMQTSPLPDPETPAVSWPEALNQGRNVDMRRLTSDPNPNVVSYTVNGDYGWVTACSPSRELLIGYLWKTVEYPWFNAWRHVENGKPLARGLEFGTTGLHQPFPILTAKGRIFGRPLFEYLDAGETRTKSYACFLFKIPRDYQGVESIRYTGNSLLLRERGTGPKRDLKMDVDVLFPGAIGTAKP